MENLLYIDTEIIDKLLVNLDQSKKLLENCIDINNEIVQLNKKTTYFQAKVLVQLQKKKLLQIVKKCSKKLLLLNLNANTVILDLENQSECLCLYRNITYYITSAKFLDFMSRKYYADNNMHSINFLIAKYIKSFRTLLYFDERNFQVDLNISYEYITERELLESTPITKKRKNAILDCIIDAYSDPAIAAMVEHNKDSITLRNRCVKRTKL